jgi:DNA-binding transcriptional MocR family regulator
MSGWNPQLDRTSSVPLYRQLLETMAMDISSGRLAAGTKLPPHRKLADALSISVGAVTRAYDEATERGLVSGEVGRGTFVRDRSPAAAKNEHIDLSINLAPIDADDAIFEAVTALRRRPGLAGRLSYQSTCGLDGDRQAVAAWLERTANFDGADWRSLICCSGAQNAMAIAFTTLCTPGDVVLCEAATFPGMKVLAGQLGYRLHGVDMDAEGATPESLDRAAAETGARVYYALPTLQNPTARTMGQDRRAEIVRVARARDLWIIEDDVYAPYARDLGLRPLAAMAPERTLYVSSLSKIIAPGLRAGSLIAPAGEVFDRCARSMRALMHSPAGITVAIATHLIESGRADDLANAAIAETRARTARARTIFEGLIGDPTHGPSLHLWLPMGDVEAERAVARASHAGVRLNSPTAFAVSNNAAVTGLRLCIGSAADRPMLERALVSLKEILMDENLDLERGIV